jgi:aspartyl-tRNA synthetase
MQKPFPRIPYREVMETYGSDRPDLRFELKIQNVSVWAKVTDFKVFREAEYVRALVVPGGAVFTRKEIDEEFTDVAKRAKAKGLAWMKYVGGKFDGTIVKFFKEEELTALASELSPGEGSMVFFVADSYDVTCKALGAVRHFTGEKMKLADPNLIAWAWVVDFPFFEWSEQDQKVDFCHNPFSMPQGGLEALTTKDPLDILAYQYDIIANGLELSSGGVRNYDAETLYKAFEIVGYTKDDVNKKFSGMLHAFSYGAPPTCGFAPGIDRLIMLFLGEKDIRHVIPFPKNQRAEEPMMGSPSEVDPKQLKELNIRVDKIG